MTEKIKILTKNHLFTGTTTFHCLPLWIFNFQWFDDMIILINDKKYFVIVILANIYAQMLLKRWSFCDKYFQAFYKSNESIYLFIKLKLAGQSHNRTQSINGIFKDIILLLYTLFDLNFRSCFIMKNTTKTQNFRHKLLWIFIR